MLKKKCLKGIGSVLSICSFVSLTADISKNIAERDQIWSVGESWQKKHEIGPDPARGYRGEKIHQKTSE